MRNSQRIAYPTAGLALGLLAVWLLQRNPEQPAVGVLAARSHIVTAPCDGRLIETPGHVGTGIPKGTPLARLSDEEAEFNRAELTERLAAAERQLARARQLAARHAEYVAVTPDEFAHGIERRVQTLREQLASGVTQRVLTAPHYGMVLSWKKRPGDRVRIGEPLAEFADREQVHLEVAVPTGETHRFGLSQPVQLLFPDGTRRKGVISHVAARAETIDRETGKPAVVVRVEPVGKLWPRFPLGTQIKVYPH